MRTHFLKDLRLKGAETILALEPEFDFYKLKIVRRMVIDMSVDEIGTQTSRLELQCEYQGSLASYATTILFFGVRELHIPPLPPFIRLNELEIADVRSRGLEGINYEAVTQYGKDFVCRCEKIEIVDFRKS